MFKQKTASLPKPFRGVEAARWLALAAGACCILLALLLPMTYAAPMEVIPASRGVKISMTAGQTIRQAFDAAFSFTQVSVQPSAVQKAKGLVLELRLLRGGNTVAEASVPLAKVRPNSRIRLDTDQPAGAYELAVTASGEGEVKLTGSAADASAPAIRLQARYRLYSSFPMLAGLLLMLLAFVPFEKHDRQPRPAAPATRSPARFTAAAALLTLLCVPAAAFLAFRPEALGIAWEYPSWLEGDIPASIRLFGRPFHLLLFVMLLASAASVLWTAWALLQKKPALHRVVFGMLVLGGVMMLCRPMLFEVGFDEGQHRLIVDQFTDVSAFSLRETLYFSSGWNIGLLPHILGAGIGRMIGLGAAACYLLGAAVSLLVYAALAACAVRIAPRAKGLLAMAAVLPTNLFLAVTTTYDMPMIAAGLLGVAMLLRLLDDPEPKVSRMIAFLLTVALCTIAKSAYCALLLLLLLPGEKWTGKKRLRAFRAFVVVFALLCMLGRVAETGLLLSDAPSSVDLPRNMTAAQSRDIALSGDDRMEGTSTVEQLQQLRANPQTGIGAMLHLLLRLLPRYAADMAATYGYFGSDAVSLWLLLALLVLPAWMEHGGIRLRLRQRIDLLLIALLPPLVLGMTMYLVSTKVGSPVVEGMQPRYLLPALPLCLLALTPPARPSEQTADRVTRASLALMQAVLIWQAWSNLFLRFYG